MADEVLGLWLVTDPTVLGPAFEVLTFIGLLLRVVLRW